MATIKRLYSAPLPAAPFYTSGVLATSQMHSPQAILPETMMYTQNPEPFATLQSMNFQANIGAPLETLRGGYSGEDVTQAGTRRRTQCALLSATSRYNC